MGPAALFSTLGRIAARGIETRCWPPSCWTVARPAGRQHQARATCAIHDGSKWDPATWPAEAQGYGFHEAPRGALGHWVQIKDGDDRRTTSAWCRAPGTARRATRKGQRGPYEAALIGTPVADPNQPVEILRTIHSFDPCMACAVHVTGPAREPITRIQVA